MHSQPDQCGPCLQFRQKNKNKVQGLPSYWAHGPTYGTLVEINAISE